MKFTGNELKELRRNRFRTLADAAQTKDEAVAIRKRLDMIILLLLQMANEMDADESIAGSQYYKLLSAVDEEVKSISLANPFS